MKIDLDVGGSRARVIGMLAAVIMGGLMFAYRPDQHLAVTLGPALLGLVVFTLWEWHGWRPVRQRIGGVVAAVPIAWGVAVTGGADSPFVAMFFLILVYEAMVRFTPWFWLDVAAVVVGVMLPAWYDPSRDAWLHLAIMLIAAGGAAGFARLLVLEANQQAEELDAYEARFRRLADGLDAVVYWLRLTPDVKLEYINPSIERITGFPRQAFLDDPDLLKVRVREEDAVAIERSLTTDPSQATAGQATYRFTRADGTNVWLQDHFVPHKDRFGAVVALQGMMFDISAQMETARARERTLAYERRAAAHLRGTVEIQQTFLQSVSHELRTPLTTVVGAAQLLRSGRLRADSPEYATLLDRLMVQAEVLQRKLQDMAEVAGIGADGDLTLETIDLSQLVLAQAAEADLGSHRLHLEVEPALLVNGDRQKLARLVGVLLDNAARHTQDGASIWVELRDAGEACLRVDDNGPGVPEELREVIFHAFRQGDDAHRRSSPGTGMGLAVAQRTALLHRGTICCTTNQHGGARFEVRLPVVPR